MIEHGWLQEVDANLRRGEPLWRETGDGHGTTLIATEAGLLAIGIEPVVAQHVTNRAQGKAGAGHTAKGCAEASPSPATPKPVHPRRHQAGGDHRTHSATRGRIHRRDRRSDGLVGTFGKRPDFGRAQEEAEPADYLGEGHGQRHRVQTRGCLMPCYYRQCSNSLRSA
jgi:hypothetical protein